MSLSVSDWQFQISEIAIASTELVFLFGKSGQGNYLFLECFNLDKVLVAGEPLGHCRAEHPQGHHVGQAEDFNKDFIFRCNAQASLSQNKRYMQARLNKCATAVWQIWAVRCKSLDRSFLTCVKVYKSWSGSVKVLEQVCSLGQADQLPSQLSWSSIASTNQRWVNQRI